MENTARKKVASVRAKTIVLVAVGGLIILNLFTFIAAYPQTLSIAPLSGGSESPRPLAKDFCAYYVGAWRLFHDPSQVYTVGFVNDGEPPLARALAACSFHRKLVSLLLERTLKYILGEPITTQ